MIGKNFGAKLHQAFTQDTLSAITSCFIVVMFGFFPSFWGPGGYTNITFTKYCCLLICSGLYLLVLLVYWLVKLCRREVKPSLRSLSFHSLVRMLALGQSWNTPACLADSTSESDRYLHR